MPSGRFWSSSCYRFSGRASWRNGEDRACTTYGRERPCGRSLPYLNHHRPNHQDQKERIKLSGELERVIWGSSSVQRQHARDRAALQRGFSLAESQVIGIGQVTDTAITEAMKVNLVRRSE